MVFHPLPHIIHHGLTPGQVLSNLHINSRNPYTNPIIKAEALESDGLRLNPV